MQKEQLYDAAIGERNRSYYVSKFGLFDKKGPGLHASWNWPALLASAAWALYRKMYLWFFLLLGLGFFSGVLQNGNAPLFGSLLFFVGWVGFAVFANSLYYENIKKRIAKAQLEFDNQDKLVAYLKDKGGVNAWVPWVCVAAPILLILLALLIPAFLAK